jgi:hypothetical protein
MSTLHQAAEDYLAIRRSLGFKLVAEGYLLASFVNYAERAGARQLTTDLALDWATRRRATSPLAVVPPPDPRLPGYAAGLSPLRRAREPRGTGCLRLCVRVRAGRGTGRHAAAVTWSRRGRVGYAMPWASSSA